jgi:rhamnosyl/mannosyltransferase
MENFLGDLLPSLKRLGVDVSALVHNHRDSGRKAKITDFPVYRVPCYGNLLYAPVSPGFLLVLKQVIKKFRPDILHIHMPNTSAFWVMTLSSARRIPWVIQWQADVVSSEIDCRMAVAYRLYRPFEQHLLRRAVIIIATSRPYLITSNALYPWKNKCTVIPLGIDSARLKMVNGDLKNWAQRIWGHKRTRVLAIGRLTYYKGHEVLIRAAARAPDLRVLIVGEGGRKRRLDTLIANLGLRERVTLLGFLEEDRLHALLASCDCLCLPSVERTEAFGLVLLEAMRYAKPVVASDVPGSGIGRVVKHEETGFLIPPGDSIELARALGAMAKTPALRGRMGQAAEERFNKIYQIDRASAKIMGVYEAILRNRS